MMCYLAPPRHSSEEKGFSLIEAAIVLGVVGIVIGGIWYAATSVQQSQRINNTAAGIIQLAQGTRRLFSHSDYPTVYGTSLYVTSTVAAAGIPPGDFQYVPAANVLVSPMDTQIYLSLACWGTAGSITCPMLQIALYAPPVSSDCVQLIRRFAGLAKDNSDIIYVQRNRTSGPVLILYPPIDPTLVTCPADTTHFNFWFRP